jgi:diguanylate cyclase (GGDEF)-like protein
MVAVWAGVSVLRPDTSGIRGPWWSLWMPLAIWTGVSLGHVIRVPLGMWVVLIGVGLGIDGHPSMRTRAMGAGIVVVAAVWLTWLGGPSWERAAWAVAWLTAVSAAAVLRPGLTRNRVAAILAMAVLVSLPLSSQPVVAGTGTVVAGGWLALYLRFWLRQQQSWAERRYQAEHDALTGALSRWGLKAWQSRQLLTSLHGLVVAFDLDQFKWFNDTYGHLAGDRVLEQIATRLMLVLPPEAVLVRTGGDEFQVWAPHRTEGAQDALADQLFRVATADPFYVDGRRFRLGVSMGAASGPLGAKTAEAADRALMEAKRSGKNCLKIAGPNAPADVADRRDMPLHLGWLAGAADMLWAGWDRPAALLTRDGQLLYGNEGFTQHLASSVGRIVDNVLGSVENGSPARPPVWRGIVAWPRAPERITWAQETVVPVIVGQHAVGY